MTSQAHVQPEVRATELFTLRDEFVVMSPPRRVLFVLGEFPVLSETFVLDQVTGLIDRDIDVAVLARRPAPGALRHTVSARYELERRTHYVPGSFAHALRAAPALARWLQREPRSTLRALCSSLNVARHGARALALEPLLRASTARAAGPLDAIIAHFGPNGARALELRELGISPAPLITFFHGHDLSRFTRKRGSKPYARLFRDGELMLAVCEHWRRRLLELGCAPEKVQVFRMGVALAAFEFRPRCLATRGETRVLSVGRLVEKKGFEFGLRAVARAAHDHPGLRYDIVGDGPQRQPLERLARELGLGSRVRFLGRLARNEVEEVRRQADLFLAPSVTASEGDQEGIPVVLMEAMASGIPVVASWHSGIPELVTDAETGLLAPERDVAALAAALSRLHTQPDLCLRLALAARQRVAARHDQARLNDDLSRLIGEMPAARQSVPPGGPLSARVANAAAASGPERGRAGA